MRQNSLHSAGSDRLGPGRNGHPWQSWRWNLPDGCQERGIRQEALLSDPVAQVVDLLCGSAFFSPQLEIGMPESLKDLAKSSEMLLPCGGEDDDIVKVKQARLPVEAGEDAIHEAREGGRSVAKTEWNLVKFVQLSTASTKGSLCFITLCDRHLPIPAFKVEGQKPSSPMESIEEVIYPGQGVSVFDGSRVSLSKIDAEAQATVLLPHHHHR